MSQRNADPHLVLCSSPRSSTGRSRRRSRPPPPAASRASHSGRTTTPARRRAGSTTPQSAGCSTITVIAVDGVDCLLAWLPGDQRAGRAGLPRHRERSLLASSKTSAAPGSSRSRRPSARPSTLRGPPSSSPASASAPRAASSSSRSSPSPGPGIGRHAVAQSDRRRLEGAERAHRVRRLGVLPRRKPHRGPPRPRPAH